ncbi:hypothetical protein GYMLUDRAFT_38146 [Collybiopsis luxurians FD-317 M1]|nr:hypothetical protein GYMLUDRAFT_38146 [Collybiopsis luxurians FD-317 M1]
MTAFVIPNAILIVTHQAKCDLASFLSRDTTDGVIYNYLETPPETCTLSPASDNVSIASGS